MGYMTCITILNDAWETIKEHPKQFLQNIESGMRHYGDPSVQYFGVGNHANPMAVKRAEHADVPQLVLLYQNSTVDLLDYMKSPRQTAGQLFYRWECNHMAIEQLKKQETQYLDSIAKICIEDVRQNNPDKLQDCGTADGLNYAVSPDLHDLLQYYSVPTRAVAAVIAKKFLITTD